MRILRIAGIEGDAPWFVIGRQADDLVHGDVALLF